MERQNQTPTQNSGEFNQSRIDTALAWAYGGTAAVAVGALGLVVTSLIQEPRVDPAHAAWALTRVLSVGGIVGGTGVGLFSLSEVGEEVAKLARFARHHIHPGYVSKSHPQDLPNHQHPRPEIPTHQHGPADIVAPKPPSLEEQRAKMIGTWLVENNIQSQFRDDLAECNVSTRVINSLVRTWGYSQYHHLKFPVTVAGIRVFLKYNIPFSARNFGEAGKTELRTKVGTTTIPETSEDYEHFTQAEKAQMAKNGFIQWV